MYGSNIKEFYENQLSRPNNDNSGITLTEETF